jgi:SAM-dependent methyltransferase
MNKSDRDDCVSRYKSLFSKHGVDPASLGWGGGQERQNKRFEALTGVGISSNHRVLDVGCGFGDYKKYCTENNIMIDYFGIDINNDFIEVAKNKHSDSKFLVCDVFEMPDTKFDFVVSCGVFNFEVEHSEHTKHIEDTVSKMFSMATIGIAVDFLSPVVDFKQPNSYHPSVDTTLIMLKKLSDKIIFRFDYLKFEFCAYVYK